MSRSGVAAAACLACLLGISTASAAWAPPLLPTIARRAGEATTSVRCLTPGEWSARRLTRGAVAVRRGGRLFVTDHACSVIVGYATAFPHVPRAGSTAELDVTGSLYRFLVASVSRLGLGRGRADCRVLVSFLPALVTLGAPSNGYAANVRKRLLVARKRLHIDVRPWTGCPVKLPRAAPA